MQVFTQTEAARKSRSVSKVFDRQLLGIQIRPGSTWAQLTLISLTIEISTQQIQPETMHKITVEHVVSSMLKALSLLKMEYGMASLCAYDMVEESRSSLSPQLRLRILFTILYRRTP